MALPRHDDLPCLTDLGVTSELQMQVVPNASRTVVAGLHDGALRVRLMAPPIDGRANAALLAWLADALGLPRRSVRLLSGDTSRRKRVALDCPSEQVAAWLRGELAAGGP
ncbi:MAG: hypothetical protein RJA10_1650 [Pseudomonadota bacterium]|jgi:uncharacterized protein